MCRLKTKFPTIKLTIYNFEDSYLEKKDKAVYLDLNNM